MRLHFGLAIPFAAIVLVASGVRPAQAEEQGVKQGQRPGIDGKDTRLSLEDIRQLHMKRTQPGKIVEIAAEQGLAFEVTDDIDKELRKLGFTAAQIASIKEASRDRLVPGRFLSANETTRDAMMDSMQKAATGSGIALQRISTRHLTLWATKDTQKTYLADLQRAEKFLHAKCAEPIRSGLDKRTAHVVLLNNRANFASWWRAMFDANPHIFDVKDNPGFGAQLRQSVFKTPATHTSNFSVFCVGEMSPDLARRGVAFGIGFQYMRQLTDRADGALETGFANWVETAVFGSPAVCGGAPVYGKELVPGVILHEDWGLLVKNRITNREATPPADLLKADSSPSTQTLFAERWALVGLLNQQPAKFGKLLLEVKEGVPDLAAIEKVYGWDEKELSKQWRIYGKSPGKRKPIPIMVDRH